MPEHTPSTAPSTGGDTGAAEELQDPIAGVVAAELSRRFVRLCLSWAEPMVADLAAQESMLRQTGGPELAERMLAQRLYQRIDPEVFRLVRVAVPLAHAECVLARIEQAVRGQFTEVVGSAISYLLSHDRDTAIQMLAVAATMAGRRVAADVAAIIVATREEDTSEG